MDIVHPTVEWKQLYNRFYRKLEIYQMEWRNMDLRKKIVCAAPFGGPIAVRRNPVGMSKIDLETQKPYLSIYNSAGGLLAHFEWTKGPIVGWGWTGQEQLVVVVEDGQVDVANHRSHARFTTVGISPRLCCRYSSIPCTPRWRAMC